MLKEPRNEAQRAVATKVLHVVVRRCCCSLLPLSCLFMHGIEAQRAPLRNPLENVDVPLCSIAACLPCTFLSFLPPTTGPSAGFGTVPNVQGLLPVKHCCTTGVYFLNVQKEVRGAKMVNKGGVLS